MVEPKRQFIEGEWQEFKSKVYPHGMAAEQEKQVRDAFYSGAFFLFSYMTNKIPELSDEEGEEELKKLGAEFQVYGKELQRRQEGGE